jgi:hypothetical protein
MAPDTVPLGAVVTVNPLSSGGQALAGRVRLRKILIGSTISLR